MTSRAPSSGDDGATAATTSAAKGARVLMSGTLGSRLTGLLRSSLLNQLFGPTVTDAFTVAVKVPNLFRELLAEGALSSGVVPVYARLRAEDRRRFAGAVASALLAVNTSILLAIVAAAPWIVDLLLGPGVGSVDRELTILLTRTVAPFLVAVSLSAWAMGILNAEERFAAPAWAPVALNVVAIVGMVSFPGAAVPLAATFALGGLAQFLVQVPALLRLPDGPRPWWPWHPQLGAVLLLMAPFAATTSGRQIVNVVATRILDGMPSGSQTAWFNADLFLSMALGVFAVSPALAWYARLANTVDDAPEAFAGTLARGLRFIAAWTAPASVLLAVLAGPAVRIVFDWTSLFGGGMGDERLLATVAATPAVAASVVPLGLHQLLVRVWYVRQRVRVPIVVALGFLLAQGSAYAVLGPMYGIAGMAWGGAVVAWLQLVIMGSWTARAEGLRLRGGVSFAVRLACASAACGVAAASGVWIVSFPSAPWISLAPAASWWSALAQGAVGGVAGSLAYGLLAHRWGVADLRWIVQRLRRNR